MVVLFLVVACLVVGFVLYLPFLLWFRHGRRHGKSFGPEVRYTRSGYLFTFSMVIALLGGLVVPEIAPGSWFASQMQGDGGTARWTIGVVVLFSFVESVLRRANVMLQVQSAPDAAPTTVQPKVIAWLGRSWKIATVGGVPVFIRGSVPTGGLLVACFARSDLTGSITYFLAFIALIAVHELGHLVAARGLGLRVFAVNFSGMGGSCVTQVPRGVRDTFILFSGGLAAQAVLLLFTLVAVATLGNPASPVGASVVVTFTVVNLLMVAMNLVPGKIHDDLSNDGAVLWELLGHVLKGKPHPLTRLHASSAPSSPDTRLTPIDGMTPSGFEVGTDDRSHPG